MEGTYELLVKLLPMQRTFYIDMIYKTKDMDPLYYFIFSQKKDKPLS